MNTNAGTTVTKRTPRVILKGDEPTIRTRLNLTKTNYKMFQKLQDRYEDKHRFRPSNSILVSIALQMLSDFVTNNDSLPTHPDLYIAR